VAIGALKDHPAILKGRGGTTVTHVRNRVSCAMMYKDAEPRRIIPPCPRLARGGRGPVAPWRDGSRGQLALAIAALLVVALSSSGARSQVTLDVSKITCDQFTGYKITSPNNIALWLHGYYNGKSGNTIIDPQRLRSEAEKLVHYCLRKPDMPVMEAVSNLFGAKR
jgi:hypothetical protein